MELNLNIVTIRLRSSIHLGEREDWLEGTGIFPLSDTLFSAFCNGYRLLYGEADLTGLLASFLSGRIPFRLSSAFPEWEGLRFFPVPLNQTVADKDVKKIRWVDQSGWQRLLGGEAVEDVIASSPTGHIPRIGIENPSADKNPSKPWIVCEVPRVGLDRMSNHPGDRYFHFGQVHFLPDASFFFLVDVESENIWNRHKAVWRVLADEGLGGDRSVGKGLCHSPAFSKLSLTVPDRAECQLLLSLFYPLPSETEVIAKGYYEMIERKGYLYSPAAQGLKRKGVRVFKTGSVFPATQPLSGQLVDVTPEIFVQHRVYRYGIALSVPCQPRGGSHA